MRHQERKQKRKRNIKERKAKINHVALMKLKQREVAVRKKRKTRMTKMEYPLLSHQE